MFSVKTFISKDQKWYMDRLPADRFAKQYMELSKDVPGLSDMINSGGHLYGFVQIKFKDEEILGEPDYAPVSIIWGVLQNLVQDYLSDGKSTISFPDNIEMTLSKINENQVILAIPGQSRSYVLPEKDFLAAILEGTIAYHETILSKCDPKVYNLAHAEFVLATLKGNLRKANGI